MLTNLTNPFKRLFQLYVEDTRLTLTEKLTNLLSAIAFCFFGALLLILFLFFAFFGLAMELEHLMHPSLAYFIVGGFFFCLIVLFVVFKKQLLINPIARFLSKTLLKNHSDDNEQEQ